MVLLEFGEVKNLKV